MELGGCAGANAWCVVLFPGPGEPPATGRRGRGVVVSQWWWVVVVGGASGEWIWVTGDEHGDKQTRKSRLCCFWCFAPCARVTPPVGGF